MAKRFRIITSNKEIFRKFNEFNFSDKILIDNVKDTYIKKILNNINKDDKILNIEILDNQIILTKNKRFDFNIYFKN